MERKEFEILVKRIRPRVLREAFHYVEDSDESEDITQDVMLKLWSMREHLEEYRSVEALAVVMAKHLSLNRRRSFGRFLRDLFPQDLEDEMTPESRTISKEEEKKLTRLIDSLPDVQQATLRMKHIDGMEVEEIAAMTGATVNAVRVNLSRARKKILSYYIKQGIR